MNKKIFVLFRTDADNNVVVLGAFENLQDAREKMMEDCEREEVSATKSGLCTETRADLFSAFLWICEEYGYEWNIERTELNRLK